jgi:hypothetical protein
VPPTLEAPLQVPGLKAWFDSRDPVYFTFGFDTEVAAWASRDGSIAGLSWAQAASASRPLRIPSVASLGGRPAVQFDGVDDSLISSNTAAWTFMHNGSGASVFRVYRIDSTGLATQLVLNNESSNGHFGIGHIYTASNLQLRYANGVDTRETWNIPTAGHLQRDVSRWHMYGFETALYHSRVSGSSLTDPNTIVPAANTSVSTMRLGASTSGTANMKGYIAQEIYYDHILTVAETQLLAEWARAEYGVQGYQEAPMLIPGLKCWFDGRDAINTTSSGITSIVGSMGIVSLGQVTPAQRPLYVTSVAQFGGRAALQFDGVDDNLVGTVPADWTFMHDGSGVSVFVVNWIDSTGPASQVLFQTATATGPGVVGVNVQPRSTLLFSRVANNGAAFLNSWNLATPAHYARDIPQWYGWSYGAGVVGSHVTGSSLTQADSAGVPSTASPLHAFRLGNTSTSFKGFIPQLIIYDRVLTPAEWASLGAWAASQYPGVAA